MTLNNASSAKVSLQLVQLQLHTEKTMPATFL